MPAWLQPVPLLDPLRYFIVIIKGVFLKGLAGDEVIANTMPLIAIGIVTLSATAWLFSRRVE